MELTLASDENNSSFDLRNNKLTFTFYGRPYLHWNILAFHVTVAKSVFSRDLFFCYKRSV